MKCSGVGVGYGKHGRHATAIRSRGRAGGRAGQVNFVKGYFKDSLPTVTDRLRSRSIAVLRCTAVACAYSTPHPPAHTCCARPCARAHTHKQARTHTSARTRTGARNKPMGHS